MKHLILLVFLLCSFAAYGQSPDNPDLIVTITGDSLHCKIIEVTAERIQFRFGPGTIIPINRNEVRSYQYYFASATPAVATNTNTRPDVSAHDVIILRNGAEIKAKVTEIALLEIKYRRVENLDGPVVVVPKSDVFAIVYENGTREEFDEVQKSASYTKGYVGLRAGRILTNDGKGNYYGFNAAYFFSRQIGVGVTGLYSAKNYEYYKRTISFIGPLFYGHWGRRNGKFFFPTNIGIGFLKIENNVSSYGYDDISSLGFLWSLGVAYRPTRLISTGLNIEFGGDFNQTRGINGIALDLNFHF